MTDYYGVPIDDYPIPVELLRNPGIPLADSLIGPVRPFKFCAASLRMIWAYCGETTEVIPLTPDGATVAIVPESIGLAIIEVDPPAPGPRGAALGRMAELAAALGEPLQHCQAAPAGSEHVFYPAGAAAPASMPWCRVLDRAVIYSAGCVIQSYKANARRMAT